MNEADRNQVVTAGMAAISIWLPFFLLLQVNQVHPLLVLAPVLLGPVAGIAGTALTVAAFGRDGLSKAKVFAAIFVCGAVIAGLVTALFT